MDAKETDAGSSARLTPTAAGSPTDRSNDGMSSGPGEDAALREELYTGGKLKLPPSPGFLRRLVRGKKTIVTFAVATMERYEADQLFIEFGRHIDGAYLYRRSREAVVLSMTAQSQIHHFKLDHLAAIATESLHSATAERELDDELRRFTKYYSKKTRGCLPAPLVHYVTYEAIGIAQAPATPPPKNRKMSAFPGAPPGLRSAGKYLTFPGNKNAVLLRESPAEHAGAVADIFNSSLSSSNATDESKESPYMLAREAGADSQRRAKTEGANASKRASYVYDPRALSLQPTSPNRASYVYSSHPEAARSAAAADNADGPATNPDVDGPSGQMSELWNRLSEAQTPGPAKTSEATMIAADVAKPSEGPLQFRNSPLKSSLLGFSTTPPSVEPLRVSLDDDDELHVAHENEEGDGSSAAEGRDNTHVTLRSPQPGPQSRFKPVRLTIVEEAQENDSAGVFEQVDETPRRFALSTRRHMTSEMLLGHDSGSYDCGSESEPSTPTTLSPH